MAEEPYDHLLKSLLGATIILTASGVGYVLIETFDLGFAIVGLFPVVLVAGLWSLANASLFVTKRRSGSERASSARSADATGASTPGAAGNSTADAAGTSAPDGEADPDESDPGFDEIMELSREVMEDADVDADSVSERSDDRDR